MKRAGRNAVHRIAVAAALAAELSSAAAGHCATPARAAVDYGGGEPYQRVHYRLANESQYRLVNRGQYRLVGAVSAAVTCTLAGATADRFIVPPAYEPATGRGAYHA